MAGTDKLVFLGLEDVIKKLEQLPDRMAVNLIRRSMRAGGAPLLEEARRRVPVRYGALRDSLEVVTDRVGKNRSEVVVRVRVSPKAWRRTQLRDMLGFEGPVAPVQRAERAEGDSRKFYRGEIYPRNYAHLVEFGVSRHNIGKGSVAAKFHKGIKGVAKGGVHPGVRPRPFMRDAFDARKEESLMLIKQRFLREMSRYFGPGGS